MTDLELLSEYAASKSEDAFTALVRMHTGLVYAAALRQTGDAHDAEEVTQAVFLILARKAGQLPAATVLSGWLLRTTHFVALNARRKQLRRPPTEPLDPDRHVTETKAAWHAMAPVLDEALAALNESSRNAVSLRFFEGRSFKEIAALTGTSEDAAQKRVSRALELLRANFAKRGLILSTTLLVGAIGTHAIQAAPAPIIAAVTAAVGPGATGAGKVPALVRLALEAMDAARRRLILLRGGAAALIVLVGFLGVRWFASNEVPQPPGQPVNMVAAGNPPAPDAGAPGPTPVTVPTEGMLLHVVDRETGAPVANAAITVRQSAGFPNSVTNTLTTGANGECRLPVDRAPAEDWSLYVEMLKDGYALQFVNWSSARGDLIEEIPAEYHVRLMRGVTIGGVVLNQQGEPESGARVLFNVSGPTAGVQGRREGLVAATGYHVESADAEGRWRCTHAPPQFDQLTFSVAHPECIPATFGVAKSGVPPRYVATYLPEEDYRQQTATMMLKFGFVVTGSVADEQGKPVAGAKVIENRDWRDAWAAHWTGADGRFRLANVSTGALVVTVEAPGFVATDRTIQPENQEPELRLVLAPAAVLRGRVVDESGAPVKAVVSAAGGDFETVTPDAPVWTAAEIKEARFDWSVTTDAEGRFERCSAPPAQKLYAIYASGYKPLKQEFAPDGTEHLITLRRTNPPRSFRISGNVTDALTGEPIGEFQVWMGRGMEVKGLGGMPTVAQIGSTLQTTGEEGRYAFPCREPAAGYTLQIKAEGCVTAHLEIPGPLTNNCRFDFKLTRDEPVAGKVLTPEGEPASGAVVVASSAKAKATMSRPGQVQPRAARSTTDAEGRFSLPSAAEATKIIVTHTNGYAEVASNEFSRSLIITLQRWGRIEGLLRIGSRPGGGEKIFLCNRPGPLPWSADLMLTVTVDTDAEGRFAFENVPPGGWDICHALQAGSMTQRTPVEVAAGQTTTLTLGGAGWRIVGGIRLDDIKEPINWQGSGFQTLRLKSPAGQPASPQYAPVFETNGTFAIDDVPPGTYELNILLMGLSSSAAVPNGKWLGAVQKEITLPEIPPGAEVAPFEVGVLDLQPVGPR